jgi:hypothetical protein
MGPKISFRRSEAETVRRANAFLELCSGKETKITIDSIVTGDETIVLYYKPESKLESMSGAIRARHPQKRKSVKIDSKIIATIFGDCDY